MLSSGGIGTIETATRFPIRLLESGPAAGALATAYFGAMIGAADLMSFDMGGTTAKLCVVEKGQPLTANDFEVDRKYRFKKGSGLPVKTPGDRDDRDRGGRRQHRPDRLARAAEAIGDGLL